jgi:hypothetical protein
MKGISKLAPGPGRELGRAGISRKLIFKSEFQTFWDGTKKKKKNAPPIQESMNNFKILFCEPLSSFHCIYG